MSLCSIHRFISVCHCMNFCISRISNRGVDMKLLIFGTGMIVNDFLEGVDELSFNVVYLCGRNKEKVDEVAAKFHLDKAFYDVDKALASDADVVYIGLPNNLHFEFAKRSLEAGKHVIVEKPFMSSNNEAKNIFDVSKRVNKFVMEASLVFYFPAFKSLVTDLETLGEIHAVDCNFSQYSSRYDRFLKGDIAPALNVKNCGGALMDINVYNINLMLGLFGEPRFVNYSATIKNNIDVSGIATLDYGTLKASCVASKSTSAPRYISIQGELGSIYLPSSMSRAYEYRIDYNNGRTFVRDFKDSHHRMYHEFSEFIRCINESDVQAIEHYSKLSICESKVLDECRQCAGISWD